MSPCADQPQILVFGDRKSTCLNSSHEWISYAVFCLKKKKNDCGIVPTTKNNMVAAYATATRISTLMLIVIPRRLLNFLIFMSPLFTYVMLLFVFNRSRARDPAVYLAANCSGRAAQYRMRLPISTVSRVKNCRGRCTNPQCAIPKFFRAKPRFPLSITKAGKELPNCNVAGKLFAWLRSTTTVEG